MMILKFKSEEKLGTLSIFGSKPNMAIEFFHNHFANDQAESNPFCIEFGLAVFDGSKKFKQLRLVLNPNADPRISHKYFYDPNVVIWIRN